MILNIKRLLAAQKKSGEKLCLELEMSKAYFYNFMAGKKDISLSTLDRLAAGLDVNTEELLGKVSKS